MYQFSSTHIDATARTVLHNELLQRYGFDPYDIASLTSETAVFDAIMLIRRTGSLVTPNVERPAGLFVIMQTKKVFRMSGRFPLARE